VLIVKASVPPEPSSTVFEKKTEAVCDWLFPITVNVPRGMLAPPDDVNVPVAVSEFKFVGSIERDDVMPSATKSLFEKGHVSLNPPFIGIGMPVTNDSESTAYSPFLGGLDDIVTALIDVIGVKLMLIAGVTVSLSPLSTYELQTGLVIGIAAFGFLTFLRTTL
jgi:hypothetical protein